MKIKAIPVAPLYANCYIIYPDYGAKVLLIDSGGDFNKIKEVLSKDGLSVGAVLLTHGHFDHCGACAAFQKAGAIIYVSQEDENLITGDGNLARYFGYKFERFMPDNRLIEGLIELFGIKAEIIYTPGHTKGGVTIKIGDALFTGDTLMKDSYGRCDLPSGNEKQLAISAKKLFSLPNNLVIYPGHGEITTLAAEKENNPVNLLIKKYCADII